ncbi:hypothetical protein H7198_01705 [Fructobacillus sp. CRL 2054]|nr:hypothetical protein [Fructobacillus sp. CRL 2054]MDD9138328.1 hypothetical protein [Fructobacillus sp. CRL 2054]
MIILYVVLALIAAYFLINLIGFVIGATMLKRFEKKHFDDDFFNKW